MLIAQFRVRCHYLVSCDGGGIRVSMTLGIALATGGSG